MAEGNSGGNGDENPGMQKPDLSGIFSKFEEFESLAQRFDDVMAAAFAGNLEQNADAEEQILDDKSLDGIVKYIQSDQCQKIITMSGAGLSTSAGIPDFRSPGTGLYDNLQEYDLPSPQAIFSIEYFRENPEPFFKLSKELWPGKLKPTPGHYFLRLLEKKGLLFRHFTQNIDTLEHVAGISEDRIIEAHGTYQTAHCIECKESYDKDWMKEKIFDGEIPHCKKEDCEGVVKPDIVFFGENLPYKFFKAVEMDIPDADLLIVMGTSLTVNPFASLPDKFKKAVPRLCINLEKPASGGGFMAMLMGGGGNGFKFDNENNKRDVFWQGTCDDGCQLLADKLGWGDELKALIKEEHDRIDKASAGEKPAADKKKAASPDAKCLKKKL